MFEFIQEIFRGVFQQNVLDLICSLEPLIHASNINETKRVIHAQNPDEKTKREYAFILLYIGNSCSSEEWIIFMPESIGIRELAYTHFLSQVLGISVTEIRFIVLTSELKCSVNAIITNNISRYNWDFSVLFLPSQHDKNITAGSSYFYKMLRNKETRHYLTKQLLKDENRHVFLESSEFIPQLLTISPEGISPLHCYLISIDEEDYAMLKQLLVAAKSMEKLIEDPLLLDRIFLPYKEAVILPWLLMSKDREQLSNEFITEKNAEIIARNQEYVDILNFSIPITDTIPTKIEWLLKTPVGRKLVVYHHVQTIALTDPNLIPLLLGKGPWETPRLYSFLQDHLIIEVMTSFLGNTKFKDTLLADPDFENALYYCPDQDNTTSTLDLLLMPDAIKLLEALLLHPRFKERLIGPLLESYLNSTPEMHALAVSNKSRLLIRLLSDPKFKEQLITHHYLIPLLLGKDPWPAPLLYSFLQDKVSIQVMASCLDNAEFRNQLVIDSDFENALCYCSGEPSATSTLDLLVRHDAIPLFNTLLLHPRFKELLITLSFRSYPDSTPKEMLALMVSNKSRVLIKLLSAPEFNTQLMAHDDLIPLLLGKDPWKVPLLYSFLQDHSGIKVMASCLGNTEFKNQLVLDPDFEKALCYCSDEKSETSTLDLLVNLSALELFNLLLVHSRFKELVIQRSLRSYPDSNPSRDILLAFNRGNLLSRLLSNPECKKLLMADVNFIPQLLNVCAKNLFFLSSLIGDGKNPVLLLDILNNETTKHQLLNDPNFVPLVLQKNSLGNSSILTNLLARTDGIDTVEQILEPFVFNALLIHPDLIPRLISHKMALSNLLFNAGENARQKQFVCDPRFQDGLSRNEQFIPILLAQDPINIPILQFVITLGTDFLLTTNNDFTTRLISNVNFFPAFFFRPPQIVPARVDQSCFYLMVRFFLSKNHEFLHTIFSSPYFKTWVEDSNHLESFILTLFATPPSSGLTAYSNLVENDTTKQLIKLLFDIKPVRRAIFVPLSIPEEGESLALNLLRSKEGYALLKTLHQTNHTAALNQTSFKSLFKSPVIQQLIHLQRINPAWFLYIALHGDNPCEDIAFLLNQSVIFPWSPNISGRYPHHIIENLNIAETEKNYLKDLIHSGSLKYKKEKAYFLIPSSPEISSPSLPMSVSEEPESPDGKKRLRGDPAVNEKEPSEQSSQPDEIATMSACLQTLKKDNEHITRQALNSLLEQCVTWILSQEVLCSYHLIFQSLLNNQAFRSQPDFIAVLERLTSLIVAMKIRIDANDIPPVDSRWKLTDCTTEVLDTLGDILSTFQGKSLIERYLQELLRSQVSDYNHLFGVSKNLEIHAPMFPIKAVSADSVDPPHYDPYILLWSPLQCHSVMQSIAERNLEARSWLYDEWLGALISLVLNTIPSQSTCIDVGNLEVDSPWRLCLYLLNKTKLFETEFDLSTFFNLLGLTTHEETLLCEVTDKKKSKKLFLKKINEKFNTWYKQQALPQEKIIHLYSELLWSYLIDAKNPWQDELLQRLPHAIDAGALIKHTLTRHKDQLHKLKIAQLLKRIPGYPVSFLSILLSNPFYAAWLFAYRINVTRTTTEETGEIVLTFSPTDDLAGIKARFHEKENETDFLNALEWALTQPGTLFFWLYFFSEFKRHESLYAAITNFILSSTRDDLFGYDSLLPVLYDMQRSNLVNDEQKTLVTSFLELRAEEMLKIHATEPYWDIVCTLYEKDEDLAKRIKQHQEKHPWLQPSPQVRAYFDRQPRHPFSFFNPATTDNTNSPAIESRALNP